MNPWVGIGLVLAVLGAALAAVAFLRARLALPAELARKSVHVTLAAVCAAFPWIFREDWPVAVLAVLATAALAGVRWLLPDASPSRGVLHGVARHSYGELCFPLAVALTWALAPDAASYVAAVLVLGFADTGGALVGQRFGRLRYRTDEGGKTVEGSLAVLAVAAAVTFPLLLAGGMAAPTALAAAAQVGLVAALVEAIALRGFDNLLLPLATLAVVARAPGETGVALATSTAVLAALVAGGMFWRVRTPLNHANAAATALALHLFWTAGGLRALACGAFGALAYAWLSRGLRSDDAGHHAGAVAAVLAAPVGWALIAASTPGASAPPATLAGMVAVHVAVMTTARHSPAAARGRVASLARGLAAGALSLAFLWPVALPPEAWRATLPAATAALAVGTVAFWALALQRDGGRRDALRWLLQAVAPGCVPAFLP